MGPERQPVRVADHESPALCRLNSEQLCPTTKPPLWVGCVSGGVPKPNDCNGTVGLAKQRLDALRAPLRPSAGYAGSGLGSKQ